MESTLAPRALVGIESGTDVAQAYKALDQQPCAHQQHERERDFGDHQQTAKPVAMSTGAAAQSFFQSLVQIGRET